MLILEDVTKQFTQGTASIIVLKSISVQFTPHKSYAITGISGSGKSTLMHIASGLEKPSSGNVYFDGKKISELSQNEYALFLNQSIGLLFQKPHLIKELSIIENVMLPGLIQKKPWDKCYERALDLLTSVGIVHMAQQKPGLLSGGQQQCVALARTLCNNPRFLLADEPTGNLDRATGKKIVNLLLDYHHTYGTSLIISSHDTYVANAMQTVYELKEGILKKI